MPNGSTFKSSQLVKCLLLGESGAGKTGAVASLALAGYKVRILEFDNGVDSCIDGIKRANPRALANVDYMPLRDKVRSSQSGPEFDGTPTAFVDGMRLLDDWDPSRCTGISPELRNDTKFGPPRLWGSECVLVVDSGTFLAKSALNYQFGLNPTAGQKGGANALALYGTAQKATSHVISLLTSDSFNTNVVVIFHIEYHQRTDGLKGLPKTIGDKLDPDIPTYFNSMLLADIDPVTKKRRIQTVPTSMIDLKNPAAARMPSAPMPIETGLADFFKIMKE
jgi:AAA domain